MLKRTVDSRLTLLAAAAILLALTACNKNSTAPPVVTIDPKLVGVWYSSADTMGFQLSSDGSTTTLVVDTAGKLQYPTPGSTNSNTVSLTFVNASNGNLQARIRYYVPGSIDTTVTLPGTYVFSNNNNTVSISFPNPLTSQVATSVFVRSSIGAVVRQRAGTAAFLRR